MRRGKQKRGAQRHALGLGEQIEESQKLPAKPYSDSRAKKSRHQRLNRLDEELAEPMSQKILKEALHQQEEIRRNGDQKEISFAEMQYDSTSEEEDFSDDELHYDQDLEISADDEEAMRLFMGSKPDLEPQSTVTLADIIMEKIRQKEMETELQDGDALERLTAGFDPKVVQVYRGVAKFLKTYRSGRIPKAFKIIPALKNWEEILFMTSPETWSPAATYGATRIFASNLNANMAQRFYNLVLLPKIREDIAEHKKLNFHYYQALKKALFKPSAFMKGILLPLCQSYSCTLREAAILSSIIMKKSIPVLHSSAALLKIAELDYHPANVFFMKAFLDKKYALPFRVLDALVEHFLRCIHNPLMPVRWHQTVLVFAQRYKADIPSNQKEALKTLFRAQFHPKITDEIRRELYDPSRN